LLKNDRDAEGNVYGAQENYEVTFAAGWRLAAWRIGLVLLLPLVVLTWALLWLLAAHIVLYTIVASLAYLVGERLVRQPDALARGLFGCEFEKLGQAAPTGPAWLEALLSLVTRILTAPLAAAFYVLLWAAAFVPIRRKILPFLLSRAVIGGSGMLDDAGRFHLADKAPAMNCLTGYGGLLGDRPLFTFGHFFKTVYADGWLSPLEYGRLFSGRQRLQIAMGDSNLAETAEYLRIGTTLLVLDAIEAGEMPRPPRVARPLRSLRALCADSTLTAKVPLKTGGQCSALQLQRFYLEACRRFVARRADATAEARDLLQRWEDTLDALEDDADSLVGSLDWVTKRYILETAGRDLRWQARKKIDLRYHELSPQGYFQRLKSAGATKAILEPLEIEMARRNAPANTPASARGRYIREFACSDEPIAANWRAVFIGQGRRAKVIHLAQYRPNVLGDLPSPTSQAPHDSDAG
jgi:proteasome accessory factor A